MPAIMILGFDLEITRVMLVAILGGLIGILMMIPLRRALIVQQHGYLKYPEGTACAEVLKAAASAESRDAAHAGDAVARAAADEAVSGGKIIIGGFAIGFIYYGLQQIFKIMKEVPEKIFTKPFQGASISLENNPALLGVGYIIGPRISSLMMAGGVLSYLVLIPAIKFFGSAGTLPLPPETAHSIADMSVEQIQKGYILYIGAGAVAAAGIISLFRSIPLIWHGLKGGLADLRRSGAVRENLPRTDQDLSMKWVLGGIIALLIVMMIAPQLNLRFNLLGAILIVAFGFLFVLVSSRLTGEVGSSSCPTSGMMIATLLLTCLIFLAIGWTAPPYFVTALSIGGIVCIASSNGGTISQDLKTGFLVGSTPKSQQIAILIGTLASCIILGPILMKLNQSGTVYVPVAGNADFAFPPGFHADPADYLKDSNGQPKRERLSGAQSGADPNEYFVYHKTNTDNGPAGRYLVNNDGVPVYLADPGINGVYDKRPDGSSVQKFTAPKATLVSYIIKGILGGQLPWGLVLLGVFIAVVLELSGVSALAFAVGVYLPISTSAPVYVGRNGALAGRSLYATQTCRRAADRRPARGGRRQEQRRPTFLRLHRRRHARRRPLRLPRHSDEGSARSFRRMGYCAQSILQRPARRSARADSVHCALRFALRRRARSVVGIEGGKNKKTLVARPKPAWQQSRAASGCRRRPEPTLRRSVGFNSRHPFPRRTVRHLINEVPRDF